MSAQVQPFILGSGGSGKAMAKSLAMLNLIQTDFKSRDPIFIGRDQSLESLPRGEAPRLLLVANPHGLHARAILEGSRVGFDAIVAEKPACVRLEDIAPLREVEGFVSVCHGYRQMWGPLTIKELLDSGELGELVTIEGRYWQSSAAKKALASAPIKPSWKNDTALSGPHDVLVDLGAHWVDLVVFLMGQAPYGGEAWLSYANAEAPHRDTHVQLSLEFTGKRRALASISKTMHGAGNDLEMVVVGTRQSASWKFASPDVIVLGRGGESAMLPRSSTSLGSQQAPFHGTGWLEGYTEILHQTIRHVVGLECEPVPMLAEHLTVMETLLRLPQVHAR